ncbi:MAG: hypothetical protein JNM25_06215 [Planctomycetes bacterium]|nr:hypothetical protein [Planctomycetota bacterium]
MNRIVLSIVTLSGISVAYYATVGRHHQAQIAACNREIDAAYDAFDRANSEAAQTQSLQDTVATLELWQTELGAQLRFDPVASPPLLLIKALLEQAGLTIEQAETLSPNPALTLAHQRLRIVATGPFGNLFAGLQRLENSAPPTRVTDLVVRPTNDEVQVRAEFVVVRTGSVE